MLRKPSIIGALGESTKMADCLPERSEFELPVPVSRLSYDSFSGSSAKRATGKPGLALNSSSAFR